MGSPVQLHYSFHTRIQQKNQVNHAVSVAEIIRSSGVALHERPARTGPRECRDSIVVGTTQITRGKTCPRVTHVSTHGHMYIYCADRYNTLSRSLLFPTREYD